MLRQNLYPLDRPLRIEWFRYSGAFSVETAHGLTTGVSANTWSDFYSHLNNLPTENQEGRIVSPELMTVADIPIDQIPSHQRLSNDRLKQVAQLSVKLPKAEFVVGAPEFLSNATYNSLFLIRSGIVSILERKRFITPREEPIFASPPKSPTPNLLPTIRNLICADLIGYRPNGATSIQASCCWALPLFDSPVYSPPPDEERYTSAMKRTLQQLLGRSAVREVLVVDRTPPTTNIAPLNCYARVK